MAVWAFIKPIFKVHGKEDGMHYLKMAILCSVIMYISTLVDKAEFGKELIPSLTFGIFDYSAIRLFIYPALLYLTSLLWDIYDKKKKT